MHSTSLKLCQHYYNTENEKIKILNPNIMKGGISLSLMEWSIQY